MKNLQARRTQMVESARRGTQRAHRIVPAGECDGGGIEGTDGRKIVGRQAMGVMQEKYGSLELRISGSREELREFWISGIQEVGIVKRKAGKRRDAADQDRCLW